MSFLRSDLPLNQDASGRFLPWIIGFMVYFAALALATTMALDDVLSRWQTGLTGTLTVQVAAAANDDQAARLDRVVGLLKENPAIASIELLNDNDVARLLEPWLGPSEALSDLPLPTLIAVNLRPGEANGGGAVDLAALRQRLAEAVPGTTVDDHGLWLSDLVTLARSVKLLGAIVLSLVGVAAVITVIFVTRTGLSIHRRVIELVHLIGARDAYIARQFEAHALRLGLAGGIFGVGLAALTLLALGRIIGDIESPLLPSLSLGPWQWLVLALLPIAVAGIAMLTARLTVLRSLNRVM